MAPQKKIQMDPSWLAVLQPEFEQPYMQHLREFLKQEKAKGKVIFPPSKDIFNAFNSTPFDQVKVVILGQDPYHGPGQAHGLCFSVRPQVAPPPSLVNIFKEIQTDLGIPIPSKNSIHAQGYLQSWADQGVLLLNAVLTVEQGQPGSHQGKGWEILTDRAIEALSREREGLVFLLWGAYAQKKGTLIDPKRHLILKSPHPSPLSAHRGFLGNKHFSKTNQWLREHDERPIDWSVS